MVAYNFQPGFAEGIVAGVKTSTIRPRGKRRHARPGDALQLYTGQRTRACRLLRNARCTEVFDVALDADGIVIDGVRMGGAGWLARFAASEGFGSFADLMTWFDQRYGLPVRDMVLISWAKLAETPPEAATKGVS